jgi:endoglucanase
MKLTPSFCLFVLLVGAPALLAEDKPAAPEVIRIKTGVTSPLTDETGVVWRADTGFVDGETIERPGLTIGNTKTPSLYRAERYSMTKFRWKVPNGRYTVKLHFAETFEELTGPGQRVFSFNVEGREFKDFDIWKLSGGAQRAYVETVQVNVTDGSLDISFTPQVENPEINALEIIPASGQPEEAR